MDFTALAQDIAQRLAAAGRREPREVLHSAAQLVLGAHLGEHAHHAKMHELGRRSAHLCELFEHVQSVIASHPMARHWHCAPPGTGRAAHGGHGHGGGHPPHHLHQHAATDAAVMDSPWWGWAPPPLEYVVLEEERQDDEQHELEEPPPAGHTAGRCTAHPVVAVPERATGEPLGAPLNAAWAGIEGHGRHYITEEQRHMDSVRPFGDGEPDWPVHWFERG